MRILKFGGKSLSDENKVSSICKYIKNIYKKDKEIIVVVSAQGKTTDNLLSEAKKYMPDKTNKRELDVLLSTGETVSSALFAMALSKQDLPAKSFQAFQLEISTFGDFSDSKIAYINKTLINECLKNNIIAVVSGFQGINSKGEITTLGRGGSDTTASALGAIFDCDVEIYSDFDGVFSGDPRKLEYKKLKNIDYDSMILLSKNGAKVIDEKSTILAKNFKFKILSKSSSKPNLCGTEISSVERDIISITEIENLCRVSIIFSNPSRMQNIVKRKSYLCANIDTDKEEKIKYFTF